MTWTDIDKIDNAFLHDACLVSNMKYNNFISLYMDKMVNVQQHLMELSKMKRN